MRGSIKAVPGEPGVWVFTNTTGIAGAHGRVACGGPACATVPVEPRSPWRCARCGHVSGAASRPAPVVATLPVLLRLDRPGEVVIVTHREWGALRTSSL